MGGSRKLGVGAFRKLPLRFLDSDNVTRISRPQGQQRELSGGQPGFGAQLCRTNRGRLLQCTAANAQRWGCQLHHGTSWAAPLLKIPDGLRQAPTWTDGIQVKNSIIMEKDYLKFGVCIVQQSTLRSLHLFSSSALARRSSLVPSCWTLKSLGMAGPGFPLIASMVALRPPDTLLGMLSSAFENVSAYSRLQSISWRHNLPAGW